MIQKQHYTTIVLNINDIWNIYTANFRHQPKVENRYSEKTSATHVSLRSKPISREFVSIGNAHLLATQATHVSLEIYESGFGWNWVIEKFGVQKVATSSQSREQTLTDQYWKDTLYKTPVQEHIYLQR